MEEIEKKKIEQELSMLIKQLEERERKYSICDTKLNRIPQQEQLLNDFIGRLSKPVQDRVRFMLYYGGNGAGKSLVGAYITVCLMLGHQTKKYGLPFIGTKKCIWILTESGSNVLSVIEPYLLGEGSKTRIPEEEIDGIPHKDNRILKSFKLKNGCEVHIKTYEQGQRAVQGGSPDFIWMDEEPVDADVFGEIVARTRALECELLATMTPLHGITRVHDFFMIQGEGGNLKNKTRVYHVSSMDNPFTDKTWTEGLTPEEYALRVQGTFNPPTGLVYPHFDERNHVVKHVDPRSLGMDTKYYGGIDFGTSHPTAYVAVAVDGDGNHYVFDEIYASNKLLSDIAQDIVNINLGKDFEWIVRDAASAREGLELKKLGIETRPADKWSRGENDMSNRRTTILLLNELLYHNKLFISEKCKNLIKEFKTHRYKDGSKDGAVVKTDDDALDALRYLLFTIKSPNKLSKKIEKAYKEQYNESIGGMKVVGGVRRRG